MIIDNLNVIKKYIVPNPDYYWFLQIIARRKDNSDLPRCEKYIKDYYIQTPEQLDQLKNEIVLQRIVRESSLCQHAINELKLAGYGNGEDGPTDWMYQQVLEAIAVFSSHGNSGGRLISSKDSVIGMLLALFVLPTRSGSK